MEWKLFDGDHSEFATSEWYEGREAAHHLDEEGPHHDRIVKAVELILKAVKLGAKPEVSDLGCGDGGLLSILPSHFEAWGYDMSPENIDYAVNTRGVDATLTDFGNEYFIRYGDISVMTEVLEHLEQPHITLKKLPSKWLVASSPWTETDKEHYEFHLWAWDFEGYQKMLREAGYEIVIADTVDWSQIVLAVRNEA